MDRIPDSTKKKLIAHFSGEGVHLSTAQDRMAKIIEAAHRLYYTHLKVVTVKKMVAEQFGISRSNAAHYVRFALEIFGDASETSKAAMRYLLTELLMDELQKLRSPQAEESEEVVTVGEQIKRSAAIEKIIGRIAKLHGLTEYDAQAPDWEKLKPQPAVVVMPTQDMVNDYGDKIDPRALQQLTTSKDLKNIQQLVEAIGIKGDEIEYEEQEEAS